MAIAAQRFKYLDKETNVPTKDFTSLSDNMVYNNASSSISSALEGMEEGAAMLAELSESMSDFANDLVNATPAMLKTISDVLKETIDNIGKLELPSMVKDIFNSLKELDLGGVKDFLKDALKVGSMFLCNNLDFLKMFMLGFSLNRNILGGLITALLMGWLDRYCKGFQKGEMEAASKKQRIEMMFPSPGLPMKNDTAFGNFTNAYSDYNEYSKPINYELKPTTPDFLSQVSSGNVDDSMSRLSRSGISYDDKREYSTAINSELYSLTPGTSQYNNLLKAKGMISTMSVVHPDERVKSFKYANLSDSLGSMAKNLQQVNLNNITKTGISAVHNSLVSKLKTFKEVTGNSVDLMSRKIGNGNFSDFDFSSVAPTFTDEEAAYLDDLPGLGNNHRFNDMHPTTESFISKETYVV